MSCFGIIILCVVGFVSGSIGKMLHPGDDPPGFFATTGIGIAGSFIGGAINYFLGSNDEGLIQTSGILMSVVGSVLFLIVWRWWNLKSEQKSFFTGKSLND